MIIVTYSILQKGLLNFEKSLLYFMMTSYLVLKNTIWFCEPVFQ